MAKLVKYTININEDDFDKNNGLSGYINLKTDSTNINFNVDKVDDNFVKKIEKIVYAIRHKVPSCSSKSSLYCNNRCSVSINYYDSNIVIEIEADGCSSVINLEPKSCLIFLDSLINVYKK